MSQRNPMNERYSNEDRKGASRKSAASARPKSKAAQSVIIKSAKPTEAERRAAAKEKRQTEQARRREIDRKYYTPDTPRYKQLRTIWWALLLVAIACVGASFLLRGKIPEPFSMIILVSSYVFIISAFYVDFAKIRKERVAYQDRMVALEEKQKKQDKAAARAGKTADSADADK